MKQLLRVIILALLCAASALTLLVDAFALCRSVNDQGNGVVLGDGSQVFHYDIDVCEETGELCPGSGTQYRHYLKDISRQAGQTLHNHNGNMNGTAIMTDVESTWTGSGLANCEHQWNDGSYSQRAAVDAHVYAGKVYDYLLSTFGRNSFDNEGGSMVSEVEVVCSVSGNAMYAADRVYYCTVDHTNPYNAAEASGLIDVVAHEWGHGVTDTAFRGSLVYWGESGALNESFSDSVGIAVKHWYNGGTIDWIFGRKHCQGYGGIRSLANPSDSTMHRVQPDYFGGSLWQPVLNCNAASDDSCYVHTNSGVPNKMFYLLSDGGTHPVSGITVQGVGIEKAMKVLYDANMYWWPSNATFYQAMLGMTAAAFPDCGDYSYEISQVKLAWAAVGVGETLLSQRTGPGNGTVSGSSIQIPYAINSGPQELIPAGYRYRYVYPPNDYVTLTAVPDWYSYFAGWQGDCTYVSGNSCTVTMDRAKTVTAEFGLNYDPNG